MANTHSTALDRSLSQYWSISDAAQTGLDLSGDFTIEMWVKLETDGIIQHLVTKDDVDVNRSYSFDVLNDNSIRLFVFSSGDNSPNSFAETDNAVITVADGWTHVAVVVDISSPTFTFFVDGQLVQSSMINTDATSIYNGNAPFIIGNRTSNPNNLDALVDEVRVWTTRRTQSEIQDNMSVQLTGSETDLVAYWRFNDDGLDQTSNNNDLTNNNSATFSTDVPFEDLPFEISGTVTLNGNPVENATIRCIRQSDNTAIAVQTTDTNGDYTFGDLEDGELYHLAVEYEQAPDKYNALSLWDVTPQEA